MAYRHTAIFSSYRVRVCNSHVHAQCVLFSSLNAQYLSVALSLFLILVELALCLAIGIVSCSLKC